MPQGVDLTTLMLLTPHTFVGIAIGASIQNPYLAAILALLSHFAGDKVPHWDFYSNAPKQDRVKGWRPLAVMADLIAGVALGLITTCYALWVLHDRSLAMSIFVCGVLSVLPDAFEGPYIFMDKEPKLFSYLTKAQRFMQWQAPLPWGLLTQLVVMLTAGIIILTKLNLLLLV